MCDPILLQRIRQEYESVASSMDERAKRQWAAAQADALGWGGVTLVALATGMSHNTINRGRRELASRESDKLPAGRVRRHGAGRKRITATDPTVLDALRELLDPPSVAGFDPPLRWTCKSTRKLAQELTTLGHPVGDHSVAALLRREGYRMPPNRRLRKECFPPDTQAQFEHISEEIMRFLYRRQPVVCIDPGRKEFVERTPNSGSRSDGDWVLTEIDDQTLKVAAKAIAAWWREHGAPRFSKGEDLLLITEAGRGLCTPRHRWQPVLQALANNLEIRLTVCHLPLGTRKWTQVEQCQTHRVIQAARGKRLVQHEIAISLIGTLPEASALSRPVEVTGTGPPLDLERHRPVVPSRRHIVYEDWNYRLEPS